MSWFHPEYARCFGDEPYKDVMQLSASQSVLDSRMSAANLKMRLGQYSENGFLPVSLDGQFSLRRIGVRPRVKRCPSCGSIIYSRRHGQCGVCERVLPESVLFNNVEAQRVDALLRTERQQHKAWLTRIEASGQ